MKKSKIDHEKDWVDRQTIGFGMSIYVLWNRDFAMPLGFVWGWGNENAFEVVGSYVLRFARRQGVRTAINEKIFDHFKVIKTCGGTKEDGLPFLRASGYKYDPNTEQWWKLKKAKRAK